MARSKQKEAKSHSGSWRDLRQNAKGRAVSKEVLHQQRRIRLKQAAVGTVGLIGLAVIGAAVYVSQTQAGGLSLAGPSEIVEKVHFTTNGVLDQDWIEEQVALTTETRLMDVDIHALDEKLESHGQISRAVVRRAFPDTLLVDIRESRPVMRLRTTRNGRDVYLLVSDEGRVYEGNGYADPVLARLPWISGVKLRRTQEAYEAIDGVPVAALLLDQLRRELPSIYSRIRIVDLRDFDGRREVDWAVIRMKARGMGELVFSPRSFNEQLGRLAEVLNRLDESEYATLERIDLSLSDHAAVRIAGNPSRTGPRR